MKKFISSLLLAVLLLSIMPTSAIAMERYQITAPAELNYELKWAFSEGLAVVKKNGLWGAINEMGHEVIPIKLDYDWVGSFHDGLARVRKENTIYDEKTMPYEYGFINTAGQEVVAPKYYKVLNFNGGIALVAKYEAGMTYWGAINTSGEEVIPLKYYFADVQESTTATYTFHNGLAPVILADLGYLGKYGFINTSGQMVIPMIYDNEFTGRPSNFREGLAWVPKDGKWGAINPAGKVVIPFEYDEVKTVTFTKVSDANGNLDYSFEKAFQEGLAWVRKGSYRYSMEEDKFIGDAKWGAVNTSGEIVVPFDTYESVSPFSEGFAAVKKNGKWGYVNTVGQMVISPEYDWVSSFSEGLTQVTKDGKDGFIDSSGQVVIPLGKYDSVMGSFWGGIAPVATHDWSLCESIPDANIAFINTKGELITPYKYSEGIRKFGNQERYYTASTHVTWVTQPEDEKSDLLNASGLVVKNIPYDVIGEFRDGIAWYSIDKKSKWGIIKDTSYVSEKPTTPSTPVSSQPVMPSSPYVTASPTASTVLVNGKEISFDAYLIDGNNYFKLRDVAQVVNGSSKQFEVTWDGIKNAINLVSRKSYTATGGELSEGDGNIKNASASTSTIYKDGTIVNLTAYTIGGNNYFKLRDLGQTFDFNVSWDAANNAVVIDTSTNYVAD